MFFEPTPENYQKIVEKTHLAIFAENFSAATPVGPKIFYRLEPDDKGKILLEAVRALLAACTLKQPKPALVVISHAETLNLAAENALLKLFEEPRENYHFLLFTEKPSLLLPTILSRAELFVPRVKTLKNSAEETLKPLERPVAASESAKTLARALLTTKDSDLPEIALKIAKNPKTARETALEALETAVEIAYKSYFKTKNPAYLKKLPGLLLCQKNLENNGHVKLHLVADLC